MREIIAVGALTALAVTGCSSHEAEPAQAEHRTSVSASPSQETATAPADRPMSPDAARFAMTHGLRCTIDTVDAQATAFMENPGGIQEALVPVSGHLQQPSAAVAARKQYDTVDTVLWREQTETLVYKRGNFSKPVTSDRSASTQLDAQPNQRLDLSAFVTQPYVDEDADFGIYVTLRVRNGDVQDGSAKQTVASVPCGVIHRSADGVWKQLKGVQLPASTHAYPDLRGYQAGA